MAVDDNEIVRHGSLARPGHKAIGRGIPAPLSRRWADGGMVHAGMIASLSAWAAQAAGGLWPALFCLLVGVLGTFVTGSATGSNILVTDFQQTVAHNLGLPLLPIVGAQGFGAAAGRSSARTIS